MKEPNASNANYLSFAAAMLLLAAIFMAGSDAHPASLILMAACAVVMGFHAISAWKKYVEQLMDYKIKQASGSQSDG